MNAVEFRDQPTRYPVTQVHGGPTKPLAEILLDRRATRSFRPDPIPDEYLEAILRLGGQAPSGYNLQPWRFIVVRDPARRQRLRQAAMNQEKVSEAPVVLIAFAIKGEWKEYIEAVFQEGARRGAGGASPQRVTMATQFLDSMSCAAWLNRHTMIAFTTMMLVAESYGIDTAPMEGFDPHSVKTSFNLPAESEVIALLALGFRKGEDKPYPGRFRLRDFVFEEEYGKRWSGV
jgi:nitroreductase